MMRQDAILFLMGFALLTGSAGGHSATGTIEAETGRFALLVGIDRYLDPVIPPLSSAVSDAKRMSKLLTDKSGFAVPSDNVVLLLDERATKAAFQAELQAMGERVTANDVVLIYFAGYGSQVPDHDGNEPDKMDECLVFHEAGKGGKGYLVDDQFNEWLRRLHEKTSHLVVVLDAGHSGTANRENMLARSHKLNGDHDPGPPGRKAAKEAKPWDEEQLSGLVFLAGAADDQPALEVRNGGGIFTSNLIRALKTARHQKLTYADLGAVVCRLMSGKKQTPYIQGDLDKQVLGTRRLEKPLGWRVLGAVAGSDECASYEIGGPPLPGLGRGAELAVYPMGTSLYETSDPAKAIASVFVVRQEGLRADARLLAPAADRLATGDIVILRKPAPGSTFPLNIRPFRQAGGVDLVTAQRVRDAIEGHRGLNKLVHFSDREPFYELRQDVRGNLEITAPDGRNAMTFPCFAGTANLEEAFVTTSLWAHVMMSQKSGGSIFLENQKTLQIEIVPAHSAWKWPKSEPNTSQIVPLNSEWRIQVTLAEDCPLKKMAVGGLVVFYNGDIVPFPNSGDTEVLKPGEDHTFSETFVTTYPIDVIDQVVVFGTHEQNPVNWKVFSQKFRSPTRPATRPDRPGFGIWTMSVVGLTVRVM